MGILRAIWTLQASSTLTLALGVVSRSLEAVSGLESNSRVFTVQVQGLLQLQVRSLGLRPQTAGLGPRRASQPSVSGTVSTTWLIKTLEPL